MNKWFLINIHYYYAYIIYGIQYDNHKEIVHININRREFNLLYNDTYMYEKQK